MFGAISLIIVAMAAYFIGRKNWSALKIIGGALLLTAILNYQEVLMGIYMVHCMFFGHDCL